MSAPREREREVSQAFVTMASSLVNGYDVVELVAELTKDCARLLDVSSAGLLLADGRRVLHVLAASSERTRQLEVFQLQREEGPCLECYEGGAPVSVPDLEAEAERWPAFVPAARNVGIASVHALPMRLRDNVLGTLGLFGSEPGSLNDDDLALAQALADVASVALVQDHAAADMTTVNEQLQKALTSRVVLEQAKGIIAQVGDIDMEDAFGAMRTYARDRQVRLSAVAGEVVARTIAAQTLIDASRTRVDHD